MSGMPWQMTGGEVRVMREKLDACQADILHIFLGNVAIHCLPLLERSGRPTVVSFHGGDVAGSMLSDGYRPARDRLFGVADRICCRSVDLERRLVELGCPRSKIRLQRTVIPVNAPAAERPRLREPGRILQIGRLIPKKGYETSIKAFAHVQRGRPEARLAIAGEGSLGPALRALAAELGIAEKVEFLGFLDGAALDAEWERAELFLHPSEKAGGDTEGVPNALLEAMAVGLPIVATRHGGIPEVVEHGRNGLLVPERSPDDLAAAIGHLWESPVLRETIGSRARDDIRKTYGPEARRPEIEAIYRELLSVR